MNKVSPIILLILVPIFTFTSCGEKIESTWKDKPIIIDGKGNEWNDYPLRFNEDLKIVYGIVNNDSTLYCMIRFNDQQLARMMAVRGFTFWVNNSDNEKKLLGIHYRDENLRENLSQMLRSGRQQRNSQSDPSQKIIYPKGRFTLAQNDSLTDIAIKDIYGMNASAGLDAGLYCYEFSIALKENPTITHYLEISSEKSIKVGMEIAGISEEDQEKIKDEISKSMGKSGGGMHSGGGGRSGGGMGGGRGGGGMRGSSRQMPDMDGEEMWVTVKLARK